MKKKYFIPINIEMYPIHTYVFLNYKEKDKKEIFNKIVAAVKRNEKIKGDSPKLKRFKIGLEQALDSAIFEAQGFMTGYRGMSLIVVPDFDKSNSDDIDTLVHEIVHAIGHSGRYIAMPFSEDSEEFYCYLAGHIMHKVFDEINKKPKRGESNKKRN